MSTRMLDWGTSGNMLVMSKYVGKDKPSEELEKFDISELYPTWSEMNEVQKFIIEYGLKQKLADGGSSNVGDIAGKVEVAKVKFAMFVKGELTGVRLNATGAKENKRIATAVRETAKVVSLEGLLIKKTQFPDTFTDEDQIKLNGFLARITEESKKEYPKKK